MPTDRTTWGLVRDSSAPLIGRLEPPGTPDEAIHAVETSRETRIVSLVGPAGIGKSRLIQDFVIKHRALDGGALVPRVYRGSPRDTSAAFGIFARLLRARFGLV